MTGSNEGSAIRRRYEVARSRLERIRAPRQRSAAELERREVRLAGPGPVVDQAPRRQDVDAPVGAPVPAVGDGRVGPHHRVELGLETDVVVVVDVLAALDGGVLRAE